MNMSNKISNGDLMKILICTGIYPPDIGGPATYSKLLFDELPKRNINVVILSFGEVRKLPKVFRHIVYFFKVLAKAQKVDVIFAQDTVSVGLPSVIASKILHKKFIIRIPGDYAWEQAVQRFGVIDSIDDFQDKKYGVRVEFFRLIQKFVCNQAKIIITPSKYFKKIVSGWVKDIEKIITIYNGIELLNTYFNTKRQKTILSAGRLVPWKGFDFLIRLMTDLPEWRLVIAGEGPENGHLRSIINTSNLHNRVEMVGGIPKTKMLELLQSCGIFVFNTSFESFSFQAIEAMNSGIPVITTNIGSLPELIVDGEEGILVEPNNKEQILVAIKKIESEKEFRENITRNAFEKSKKFSIKNTVDSFVNLLNTL